MKFFRVFIVSFFSIVFLQMGCNTNPPSSINEPIPDTIDMRKFMVGVWELRRYGLRSDFNMRKPDDDLAYAVTTIRLRLKDNDTLEYDIWQDENGFVFDGGGVPTFFNKRAEVYEQENKEKPVFTYLYQYESSKSMIMERLIDGRKLGDNESGFFWWYRKIEWKE